MTRALALACCAACLLLSHIASAKPKVALTQIEGDASGDVRDAVAEALEGKDLALIGSREVNRAVDKLGDLADLTEKDFKKLATELEADAIVAGKLDKVGSSRTLKFRLFVHKKMAKGFTMSFKDKDAKSEKFRSLLHDKVLDKIGAGPGGDDDDASTAKKKGDDDGGDTAAPQKDPKKDPKKDKKVDKVDKVDKVAKVAKKKDDDEEDPRPAKKPKTKAGDADEETRPAKVAKADADEDVRPAKKPKAASADEDARPAKKAKPADADEPGDDDAKADGDDDDTRPAKKAAADDQGAARRGNKKKVAAIDDGGDIDGGVVAVAEPRRGANQAAIRLDIGPSVMQRSFKFNTSLAGKPKDVALSPVPGARIEAEFFPLAFSSRGAAAGLGLGFDYDKTLSLNLAATNMTTTSTVPVKQSNYSIGLRYRFAFGKTETSSTLTLGVGYGKRLFSTDLSKVTDPVAVANVQRDTPETDYTMIDPGLMFRLPVTRMVAFSVGGRGMIISSAGPIQNGTTSYGRAKVYGAEGVAAVDIVLGKHLALRFSGEYVQIGYQFAGGGKLSNGLDNDPTSKDVGGLADRSIGGAATLALLY